MDSIVLNPFLVTFSKRRKKKRKKEEEEERRRRRKKNKKKKKKEEEERRRKNKNSTKVSTFPTKPHTTHLIQLKNISYPRHYGASSKKPFLQNYPGFALVTFEA